MPFHSKRFDNPPVFNLITSHRKKMIMYASGGPVGGQPFEKVVKHAFFACIGF
jgi:hypothetical protein